MIVQLAYTLNVYWKIGGWYEIVMIVVSRFRRTKDFTRNFDENFNIYYLENAFRRKDFSFQRRKKLEDALSDCFLSSKTRSWVLWRHRTKLKYLDETSGA